jgi:hypothetical protein
MTTPCTGTTHLGGPVPGRRCVTAMAIRLATSAASPRPVRRDRSLAAVAHRDRRGCRLVGASRWLAWLSVTVTAVGRSTWSRLGER